MHYLDNAATSYPKAPGLPEAVADFLRGTAGSPGRSAHSHARNSARALFDCREALAALFGVPDSRHLLLTSGATESLNLALRGLLRPGDHVVVDAMAHNAVMRPLRHLENSGVRVDVVEVAGDGRLRPEAFADAVDRRTRLVVVNHASNVTGAVAPLAAIREAVAGVPLLVDAAQSAGAVDIDVVRDGIDLLAFTGHKALLGPQGTGGLCVSPDLVYELEPIRFGGTGSRSESERQPDLLPDRFEGGTPNTPGFAGLHHAVTYLRDAGLETLRAHEAVLTRRLDEGLRTIPGLEVLGPGEAAPSVGTRSVRLAGATPSELAFRLEREHDIGVRVGLHCAPLAHRNLGSFPDGAVRLSLGFHSREEDVAAALAALRDIAGQRP